MKKTSALVSLQNFENGQRFPKRGGFIIAIAWENGQLTKAKIQSTIGGKLQLRNGNNHTTYNTKKGESIVVNAKL